MAGLDSSERPAQSSIPDRLHTKRRISCAIYNVNLVKVLVDNQGDDYSGSIPAPCILQIIFPVLTAHVGSLDFIIIGIRCLLRGKTAKIIISKSCVCVFSLQRYYLTGTASPVTDVVPLAVSADLSAPSGYFKNFIPDKL